MHRGPAWAQHSVPGPGSCGGVDVLQLRERANELLDAGYLLVMLDSFMPRNQNDCRAGVIRSPLVWRDSLDALAHLHALPAVDKQHAARRTLEFLQRQRTRRPRRDGSWSRDTPYARGQSVQERREFPSTALLQTGT